MDDTRTINRRRSVSGIIHTLVGVAILCKVQIWPATASDYTDVEIRCMYGVVNKAKDFRRYMEALELHTGAPTVHW